MLESLRLLEEGLLDFYSGQYEQHLIYARDTDDYFCTYDMADWFYNKNFPTLELPALALCRPDARILDIGAGVGRHALHLQVQC